MSWVNSAEVWRIIKSNPISDAKLAEKIGRTEDAVRKTRDSQSLELETADRMLTVLGLSFLLLTGDLEIYEKRPLTERQKQYFENKKKINAVNAEKRQAPPQGFKPGRTGTSEPRDSSLLPNL